MSQIWPRGGIGRYRLKICFRFFGVPVRVRPRPADPFWTRVQVLEENNMARNTTQRSRGRRQRVEAHIRREVEWKGVDDLLFDPMNPRLPEGLDRAKQAELLKIMAEEYDLQEIGQSLADNGYFSEEPMVIIPAKQKFTVVEGNRRLAALKLLVAPEIAPRPYRTRWREISQSRKVEINEVPTLVYDTRDEIVPYLGYRHISGVLQWRPLQKARYIAQLVESGRDEFSEVARIIGSKAPTVRNHYLGYAILRYAKNSFGIDTTYAEDAFGVWQRALNDPSIRDYMGLKLDLPKNKRKVPIPKDRTEQLSELLLWIFGDGENDAVLRDSREISKLGTVLQKAETIAILKQTNDLEHAFARSGGEEKTLIDHMGGASFHLDQSLPLVIRHKESSDVSRAVETCWNTFKEILRHFPQLEKRRQ